jgi:hypothetical protein
VKQGYGTYVWMGPASEEDETLVEKSKYEGNYKDGYRQGVGKMKYPNGDVYEGEFFENMVRNCLFFSIFCSYTCCWLLFFMLQMQGEGTYTYKASGDIYSGSWLANLKHGNGTYEFGKDSSLFVGTWEKGQITTGKWILQGAAVYEGNFKLGRPVGNGTFTFASGLVQNGSFEVQKAAEGEEEPVEGEAPKPQNVAWKGDSIVSF